MNFPATITDQMGHEIKLKAAPRRIISLVPSQTELLADLGLDEEVVGITKFCVHPESWFRSKTRVGGTKTYHFDKIATLQPDLIIGNKEENDEEQVRQLQKLYPVWMSDICNLDDAMNMIRSLGTITQRVEKSNSIVDRVQEEFRQLAAITAGVPPRRAVYLIWKNPYMTAGQGTFINEMLKRVHLENVLTHSRYPETTLEELARLQPEVILLSSEPYPFSQKHSAEIQEAIPQAQVMLVDGEMFSWYGSRLLQAPAYFKTIL